MCRILKYLPFLVCIALFSGCVQQESSDILTQPSATIALPTATASPSPTDEPELTPTYTPIPTSTPPHQPLSQVIDFGSGMMGYLRMYGNNLNDFIYDILSLEDGGTLIAGQANNIGMSHRIVPGRAQIIRTDSEGEILWQKDYGGDQDASFSSIIQVAEDEFVAIGEIAASYSRDETDIFLVKVDGKGYQIWSQTFGGRGMDHGKSVQMTVDGGYILFGSQADEFPTDNLYEGKLFLIKTDSEGSLVWSKLYGEESLYLGTGVVQTPDGGYALTGWEADTYDDRDVIIIKVDQLGEVEWSRIWDLADGERDGGYDLILSSDGNLVIACIQAMGSGGPSAVLLKVDLSGNQIWRKMVGTEGIGNTIWHIAEDTDGGYLLAGDTHLGVLAGTQQPVHGAWMVKTDKNGEVVWQQVFNQGDYDQARFRSVVVTAEGEYLFVGDGTFARDMYSDMLWMKLETGIGTIAYTSQRGGNFDIYTISTNGKNIQRLTDDPAYDGWPSWSPDGSQIAFMSKRNGNPDIYVMDADGSHVRQLTFDPANDIWPEWSPDGTRIVFPSRRDGNFELYTISPDGTTLQRLTNTPGHEDFPAWSPDGTQIIFSRIEQDEGTFIMNADGSGERKLLDFMMLEPAWSPDGAKIVFGSNHENFQGVYMIDVDGSNLQRISDTILGENCPSWSPDGTKVVFTSWREGDGEIYIMDAGGSNLIKLTDNRSEDEFPAWQPVP